MCHLAMGVLQAGRWVNLVAMLMLQGGNPAKAGCPV